VATCGTLLAIVAPLAGRWPLSVLAFTLASGTALWLARTRDRIDPRALAVAAGVVLVTAVVVAPTGSRDLWSYAMVGRTVVVHHANPYVSPPRTFASDPFLLHVGRGWRHTTTPYGPVFVAYAAAVARVAGSHVLLARLGFQLGAAAAVASSLWLLWRATGSTRSVALLALHPVVAMTIVNGGHNDAFVGLAILGAVLLARARRHFGAGMVLALGALVKLPAGLALLPLSVWVWKRRGARAALTTAAPAAALSLLSMVVVPGAIRSVVGANARIVSRGSVWNVVIRLRHAYAATWGGGSFSPAVTRLGLLAVLAVAAGAAWRAARVRSRIERDVTIATGSWLFLGAYALPWYAGWSLPVAALQSGSALTAVIALQAAFLGASQQIPPGVLPQHVPLAIAVHFVLPVLGLAAFLFTALRRRTRTAVAAWVRSTYARAAGETEAGALDRAT
jgi:hypothetical protein